MGILAKNRTKQENALCWSYKPTGAFRPFPVLYYLKINVADLAFLAW